MKTSEETAEVAAFSDTLRVRYRDTDAQGHLYFANYMVFADEVAGAYLASLGFHFGKLDTAPCLIFTVNINCDYHDECRVDDEVLVRVGYTRLGRASATLGFSLELVGPARKLASGSLTQVFVDKQTRGATPIPGSLRAAILERQPELAEASG